VGLHRVGHDVDTSNLVDGILHGSTFCMVCKADTDFSVRGRQLARTQEFLSMQQRSEEEQWANDHKIIKYSRAAPHKPYVKHLEFIHEANMSNLSIRQSQACSYGT
jgi:hypothetical protein